MRDNELIGLLTNRQETAVPEIQKEYGKYLHSIAMRILRSVEDSEEWREDWAKICNSYLEQNGVTEKIDHRSYERQGKEEIPNIHNSVAVNQMEQRGIPTNRGKIHREIQTYNKDLSSMRARITRLKAWQRDLQARPLDLEKANVKISVLHVLESQVYQNPKYRNLTNLKNMARAIAFLETEKITDLNTFWGKIDEMNKSFYVLSGEVKKKEKQEAFLQQKISLAEEYKDLRKHLKKLHSLSPKEQKEYRKKYGAKVTRAEEIRDFFQTNLADGEKVNVKQWKADLSNLGKFKEVANWKCDAYKEELRVAELLRELFEEQAQVQEQERGKKRGEER